MLDRLNSNVSVAVAKILDHETRLTRTNATVGTPYYMAPEQIRGGQYTGAVDAYALGVILYIASSGEFPFEADDKATLFRSILCTPPTPPWELGPVPRERSAYQRDQKGGAVPLR